MANLRCCFLALAAAGWLLVFVHGVPFDADPARMRPADAPEARTVQRVLDALGPADAG